MMFTWKRSILSSSLLSAILALPLAAANACDMCAIYTASDLNGMREGAFAASIQEEFTKYRTPFEHDSTMEQLTRESSTRFSLSYDISDEFQAQLTLPLTSQRFVASGGTDTESGVGDTILLAAYSPVNIREMGRTVFWSIRAGMKFPTGDTGKLESQLDSGMMDDVDVPTTEDHSMHHDDMTDPSMTASMDSDHDHADVNDTPEAEMSMSDHMHALYYPKHTSHLDSGETGRTLALGTGSYDFLIGSSFVGRLERFMLMAGAQYIIRSEGDYDYRFDNSTTWHAGPGYYLWLDDSFTLALRAAASGEHKGRDVHQGNKMEGSSMSDIYFGPEILFTLNENVSGLIGFDTPVANSSTEGHERPDYRVRAALTYRF